MDSVVNNGKHGILGAFSAAFLLADVIFRVLQTKPLVKRQLDLHVNSSHKSPDHLNAPRIRVGEVWALDHSFSRNRYDLLLMGFLNSWNRKEECFALCWIADELVGLNRLDTMEFLYIIHLTRAEFVGQGHYYMEYKYVKTSNGTMEDELLTEC